MAGNSRTAGHGRQREASCPPSLLECQPARQSRSPTGFDLRYARQANRKIRRATDADFLIRRAHGWRTTRAGDSKDSNYLLLRRRAHRPRPELVNELIVLFGLRQVDNMARPRLP